MNNYEFLRKLFKGSEGIIENSVDKPLHIKIDIDNFLLQDNIDLLSKELHMEVERNAILKNKKIKHDKIYIKNIEIFD